VLVCALLHKFKKLLNFNLIVNQLEYIVIFILKICYTCNEKQTKYSNINESISIFSSNLLHIKPCHNENLYVLELKELGSSEIVY
jgi:hypothetical protein